MKLTGQLVNLTKETKQLFLWLQQLLNYLKSYFLTAKNFYKYFHLCKAILQR